MYLGAATKCFGGSDIEKVAELYKNHSLSCAELYFCHPGIYGWRYNSFEESYAPPVEAVKRAVDTFEKQGIKVVSLGFYRTFWDAGVEGLATNLDTFCSYCDAAYNAGIPSVSMHGGFPRRDFSVSILGQADRELLLDGYTTAYIEAKKRGLTLSVEATIYDILGGFEDYRRLCDEVWRRVKGDGVFKFISCPCSDRDADSIPESEISMYHLKDIVPKRDYYTDFGSGVFDFSSFLKRARVSEKPIILEFVREESLALVIRRLDRAMAEQG